MTKFHPSSPGPVEQVDLSSHLSIATLFCILFIGIIEMAATSVGRSEDETDVAEVTITTDRSELRFDKKEFTVKAGRKVRLTLVNPDDSLNLQAHNLLVIEPGTLEEVGTAADAELSDPAFLSDRHAIPTSNYVLYHTKLLQPGESEIIEFTAPESAGEYPFLCSYPGHWRVMNGVMIVD